SHARSFGSINAPNGSEFDSACTVEPRRPSLETGLGKVPKVRITIEAKPTIQSRIAAPSSRQLPVCSQQAHSYNRQQSMCQSCAAIIGGPVFLRSHATSSR